MCGGREGGRDGDGDGNVWFDTLLWIIYAWAEFGRRVNEMELSFCIALLCYGLGAMLRVDRLVKSRLTAVLTWVWKNEACIHIAACAQKIQF